MVENLEVLLASFEGEEVGLDLNVGFQQQLQEEGAEVEIEEYLDVPHFLVDEQVDHQRESEDAGAFGLDQAENSDGKTDQEKVDEKAVRLQVALEGSLVRPLLFFPLHELDLDHRLLGLLLYRFSQVLFVGHQFGKQFLHNN